MSRRAYHLAYSAFLNAYSSNFIRIYDFPTLPMIGKLTTSPIQYFLEFMSAYISYFVGVGDCV
jgi:hypothetical protein